MASFPKIPTHIHGTTSLVATKNIASFPTGTFLENLAVRQDGSLLVSDMTGGSIYYINPHSPKPQSTVLKIHDFNPPPSPSKPTADEQAEGDSAYGTNHVAQAIIESPSTPDLFYTFSGQHGKTGTWAVYSLDLRIFNPSSEAPSSDIKIEKIAEIPTATWLNGATILPSTSTLVIAESTQGKLISVNLRTGNVSTWLKDPLLGKVTGRPPWPGVNGVQYFRGRVFATNSDRAIVLRADVDEENGVFVPGSLTVVAEGMAGDDLAFDVEGNAYVATNPAQTVVRLPSIGVGKKLGNGEWTTILGGVDVAETAGPTAVAFGRTEEDWGSIYVVTTGGMVKPVGSGLELARVVRADVGTVKGEGV